MTWKCFQLLGLFSTFCILYFLVVPITHAQNAIQIVPMDAEAHKGFGFSSAISGEWAVVGAPGDPELGQNTGSAYVWHYENDQWVEFARLTAFDATANSWFGYSVDIHGDNLVVGSLASGGTGAAYHYQYINSQWMFRQRLVAIDSENGDRFGFSVAIDADQIVAGAYLDQHGGNLQGAAYVFQNSDFGYYESQRLIPSTLIPGNAFGWSVALHEDRILVGAPEHNSADASDADCKSGSIFVFDYNGSMWEQTQEITASNSACSAYFGWDVEFNESQIVVGSPFAGGLLQGGVYCFEQNAGQWTESQLLEPDDPNAIKLFGYDLSLDQDYLAIGAASSIVSNISGSVTLYNQQEGQWQYNDHLLPNNIVVTNLFGRSVSIGGSGLFVGAPGDSHACPTTSGCDSGAIYLYDLNRTPSFRRADTNNDGDVNIADAVYLLGYLFPGSLLIEPTCESSLDINDSGDVNLPDVISLLSSLLSTPPFIIPSPHAFCGSDPTPDGLDCLALSSCP